MTPWPNPMMSPGAGMSSLYVIQGTLDDDRLHGTADFDVITGLAGNDTLFGGESGDRLDGGGRDDVLFGGKGYDDLWGRAGVDRLVGGPGNDVFHDDPGGTMDGGGGYDLVYFFKSPASVQVDLAAGVATSSAGTTEMISIESVFGTDFNDLMIGDGHDNTLYGRQGDDTLQGGGGHDYLVGDEGLDGYGGSDAIDGGAGRDTLTGGAFGDALTGGQGADTFLYEHISDSYPGYSDLIEDLTNQDTISLASIDAKAAKGHNQPFRMVDHLDGHAGQAALAYDPATDRTSLLLDVNGDAQADAVILIAGDHTDFTNFIL